MNLMSLTVSAGIGQMINRRRSVVSMCKITSPWEESFLVSAAHPVRNEVEQWQQAVMLM